MRDPTDVSANDAPDDLREVLNRNWKWLEPRAGASADDRATTKQILEDLGHYEESVRQAYTGRYPVELLQNAHDACEEAGVVGAVRFVITDRALLVSNVGVAFNSSRIESLTRIGSSEKAKAQTKRKTIGYKGVGFTAVFEITDAPQIITRGIAFGLDRGRAHREVRKMLGEKPDAIPARLFPFELGPSDWLADAEEVDRLIEQGAVTVVRLPFARRLSASDVGAHMQASIEPTALLFLDSVSEIEVRTAAATAVWKKRLSRPVPPGRIQTISSSEGHRESWLVTRDSARIPRAVTADLNDRLWKDVREVDVAVAVPWSRGIDGDAEPQSIHVYFPTDDLLGRSVLIHGDFYVDQSRRHIEENGPGGEISYAVAEKAASIIADIAALHVGEGQALLSCLAVKEAPSGYGRVLDPLIDEQLKKTRFVRTAAGEKPRRPGEVRRLPTPVGVKLQTRLVTMIASASDLVRPGDDTEWAGELLSDLDVEELSWKAVADRLDGASHSGDYDDWVGRLGSILSGLSPADHAALLVNLPDRPVLRDQRNRWRPPASLFVRRAEVPELPSAVANDEVLMPARRNGRAAVYELVENELSSATALTLVLEALDAGRIGDTQRECKETLAFLRSAWVRSPRDVSERGSELGIVKVPVRVPGGHRTAWRPARSVYFGRAWTGDPTIEVLYGRLEGTAVLAPPGNAGLTKRDGRLLRALGVAAQPRNVTISGPVYQFTRNEMVQGWVHSPEVHPLLTCPDHPQTSQNFSASFLDGIDAIVSRRDRQVASALARTLARSSAPLGPAATIACPSHRRGQRTRVPGPQEWVLTNTAWVPVANDPGGADRRGLLDVWCDIPTGDHGPLLIPRARFPTELSRALGITTPERATPEAVERALTDLESAFPALADAPANVHETATWLLTRLRRAARRHRGQRTPPPLPAFRNGVLSWSSDPVIPDLSDVELLPELPVLPRGRWDVLRRVYELKRASAAVNVDVVTTGRLALSRLLTLDRRAQLLAVLAHEGADERQTAFRLSERALREVPVKAIELRMTTASVDAEVHLDRRNHLQRRHGARGQLTGANLFLTGPVLADQAVEVAAQLANYLDVADADHTIAWHLLHGLDGASGIADEELSEAGRALRRHGRGRQEKESELSDHLPDVVPGGGDAEHAGDESDEGGPAPPGNGGGSREGGPKQPVSEPPPLEPLNLDEVEVAAVHQSTSGTAGPDGGADEEGGADGTGGSHRGGGGGGGGRVDLVQLRAEQALWGQRGEQWVFEAEKRRLRELGYPEEAVVWESQENPTSPYDIASLDDNANKVFIEVKATTGDDPSAPFPISRSELLFGFAHRGTYWIYRVTDIRAARPPIVAYRDPLGDLDTGQAALSVKDAYLRLPMYSQQTDDPDV